MCTTYPKDGEEVCENKIFSMILTYLHQPFQALLFKF